MANPPFSGILLVTVGIRLMTAAQTNSMQAEKGGTLMSQHNVSLVQSLYEAFARGDIPAIMGAMDPDNRINYGSYRRSISYQH